MGERGFDWMLERTHESTGSAIVVFLLGCEGVADFGGLGEGVEVGFVGHF